MTFNEKLANGDLEIVNKLVEIKTCRKRKHCPERFFGSTNSLERDAVESIRPGNIPLSCPPANRRHSSGRLFGSTNIRKSYVNLSNPKPEHITGGSRRRGARRSYGARRGQAEQNADVSGGPRANCQSSPPGYRGQLS